MVGSGVVVGCNSNNIQGAVIEAIVIIKRSFHCEGTIGAVETNISWTPVLISGLYPQCEYVAGCKDCLGLDNHFNRVSAIKANLAVDCSVWESQWEIALLGAAVIQRGLARGSNRARHRGDVFDTK